MPDSACDCHSEEPGFEARIAVRWRSRVRVRTHWDTCWQFAYRHEPKSSVQKPRRSIGSPSVSLRIPMSINICQALNATALPSKERAATKPPMRRHAPRLWADGDLRCMQNHGAALNSLMVCLAGGFQASFMMR